MAEKAFSRGIEKVVWLAALDREFCRKLFEDRRAALDGSGIEMTGAERMLLGNISDAQLMSVIERVSVPRPARRAFLRGTVATAFALMGTVVATSACTFGIQPDATQIEGPADPTLWLKEVWFAQEQYRAEHGRYAGTFEELIGTNCLDSRYGSDTVDGYALSLHDATETTFQARALPQRNRERPLFIDQTGIVREFKAEEEQE